MSIANEGTALSGGATGLWSIARLEKIAGFVALTKPRVMSLVIFTAVVGLIAAPGHVSPTTGVAVLLCISVGAGAAGALNMWYDADIDALMGRTSQRPIPCGRISRGEALAWGLIMAATSVVGLALVANVAAAGLLASTILFYVVIYTIWLKRSTPQSIVIGGAAGAAPPVIAWFAAAGRFDVEPVILFLIIFLWTPPHFWTLALNRVDDYARAGIPTLPVVSGEDSTRRQILIYAVFLVLASLLPCLFGFAHGFYGGVAITSGVAMLTLCLRLRPDGKAPNAASQLFGFSICYFALIFGALLAEKSLSF